MRGDSVTLGEVVFAAMTSGYYSDGRQYTWATAALTGTGVSGLKGALTVKRRGSRGWTCLLLVLSGTSEPSLQSCTTSLAPAPWLWGLTCGGAGCLVSFCPLQGSLSSQSFSLLPLSASCLTVLSELEWCLAWWKGKALVLPTKLCQCKSVQDLDQHFCLQCSGLWSAYVWLIAWLLMPGRSGKMGAIFIVILKELLPPAPTEMYHPILHSHNTSFSVFFSTVT